MGKAGFIFFLLSVHCDNSDQVKRTLKVLEMIDARDVAKSSEYIN